MDNIIRDKTNIFVKHVFVKTFLVMSFPSLSSAFDIPMEGSDLLVRASSHVSSKIDGNIACLRKV